MVNRSQNSFNSLHTHNSSLSNFHNSPFSTIHKENLKDLLIPEDQLKLTPKELGKEHTRILTLNSGTDQNKVRFSFTLAEFEKLDKPTAVCHFQLSGSLIHRNSDGARRQVKKIEKLNASKTNLLKNKFNYQIRGVQTLNNPIKSRHVQTIDPVKTEISLSVNQFVIYDEYEKEEERLKKQKLAAEEVRLSRRSAKKVKRKPVSAYGIRYRQAQDSEDLVNVKKGAKILERMVTQNLSMDILDDYKYFEDEADQYRDENKGSLLPLWKLERVNQNFDLFYFNIAVNDFCKQFMKKLTNKK